MCKVFDVNCDTADEFLDALSLRSEHLRIREEPRAWLFRGHGSDAWKLIPLALRDDGALEQVVDRSIRTNRDQIKAEIELIQAFFHEADASGLRLPEDSQETRKRLYELGQNEHFDQLASGDAFWPPYSIYTLLALMQHHGLPTRFLDWTFDSKIAAYFAAEAAATRWLDTSAEEIDGSGTLTVWALARRALRQYSEDELSQGRWVPAVEVAAPFAEIPSLRAQNGVFLVNRPIQITLDHDVERTPFDQIVHGENSVVEAYPVFQRFTLPIRQSGRLLWLLAIEGITGASLFPGYDGVARAIRANRLHVKPTSPIILPKASEKRRPEPYYG